MIFFRLKRESYRLRLYTTLLTYVAKAHSCLYRFVFASDNHHEKSHASGTVTKLGLCKSTDCGNFRIFNDRNNRLVQADVAISKPGSSQWAGATRFFPSD
jgi:hypothetical protein